MNVGRSSIEVKEKKKAAVGEILVGAIGALMFVGVFVLAILEG